MSICGLDFGTSNSAIGVLADGAPALAPLEDGRALLPSAIFIGSANLRQARYGRAAIEAYTGGEDGRLMRALKSILSSRLVNQTTSTGRIRLSMRDVIEMFVREVKKRAEAQLGTEITSVVHGRPVRFVDNDESADARAQSVLEDIARYVGFKHVVFEFEPIAAALHYETLVSQEELILVADIGGGTSDFSVVRIGPHRRNVADRRDDILANAGARIGGTDFDKALSLACAMPLLGYGSHTTQKQLPMPQWIYHELASWPTIHFLYNYRTERIVRELLAEAAEPEKIARLLETVRRHHGHRIAGAVETAKVALSEYERALLELGFIEDGLAAEASRDAFEAAIGAWTQRLTLAARDCVRDAGVAPEAIETIFFTGGSSFVPAVRRAVAKAAPEARAAPQSDFVSVALGLTRQAQRLFG